MTAEDFKAWRRRMRWTQTRAATELGVDRRTISRRENSEIGINRETELACSMMEWVAGSTVAGQHLSQPYRTVLDGRVDGSSSWEQLLKRPVAANIVVKR